MSMGAPGHIIHSPEDLNRLDIKTICRAQGPPQFWTYRIDQNEAPPIGLRTNVLQMNRMTNEPVETITTKIWRETPEADNPFVAADCFCAGYDVYGDLLKNASFIDYLFLLFKLQPPNPQQSALLEGLAIALGQSRPQGP